MSHLWQALVSAARRNAAAILVGLGTLAALPAAAQVTENWGTIATPITNPVTFSFAQWDVSGNFSHEYTFTLQGSADASYSVTLQFDACRNGCGNAVLSYGVNEAGGLTESPTGTYLLAPGTYTFVVRATGMGAGNTVDYQGSMTFAVASADIVSPVPEPETVLLLLPGLALVAAIARRRRQAGSPRAAASAPRRGAAVALLLAAPVALSLAGCGRAGTPAPTQVVAKVGDSEISALQLELALKAQRGALGAEPERAQVVEKLIDRELAVQQALARKLDRQPEVMLRLEELRREILASAYADQLAAAQAKPTAQAIAAFHAQHPELFSQRRIYRLRELAIPASSPHIAEVRQRLIKREAPAEVAAWLARENARFSLQETLRAAEQVPLEALRKLHATPEGRVAVFEMPSAILVYEVLGSQGAPLDLAAATPFIRDHLVRQQGERAMRAELARLRASAVIERPRNAAAQASLAVPAGG